jgi:hypothetical protein
MPSKKSWQGYSVAGRRSFRPRRLSGSSSE